MRELWWSGGHTTSGRRMASRPHRWCPVTTGVIRWLVCGALVIAGLSQASGGEAGPLYRWIHDQGRSHLSDTPPPSITPPQSQGAKAPDTPGPVARPTPPAAKAPGLPIVDAEVNRRLTVRFQLAPEVELTILSKAVAAQLGLASIDHLPRRSIRIGDGTLEAPITALRSLRVGEAEARDVNVAIDVDGRLTVGLLGQLFLRRFAMTVDDQGQVTLTRVHPTR